jgi:hypothetical protein
MAYIEHNKLQDYPYFGQFFRIEIDESKPLDEQVEERVVIFETDCDITESSHSWSRNFIWAKYAIYFPFDKDTEEIEVKLGDLFEADMHGLIVNGKVVGVFPSQLGGVTVYVQDTDV